MSEFKSKIKHDKGPVTIADLEALRDLLNKSSFVVGSGEPYFVARKLQPNGEYKHELDRKIIRT